MFIKIEITRNPIKETDTTLYVMASRGILDFCQSLDRKNYYILSTTQYALDFKFMQPNTPRGEQLLIRYICKAGSPRKTATGEKIFPMPVDAPDAGQEKWFSLQVGAEIGQGDAVIKSDRSGQVTYLMSLVESRALQVWRRNPGRIDGFESALDYLSTMDRNAARLYKRATWATSEKEIQRLGRIADAEMLAEERAYEAALEAVDEI